MAYITKRGSSYSVRYTYQDEHGKSCDKWESFPTKEEAVKRQKQIEHELATGNFLIPSTVTVAEFLMNWLPKQCSKHKWAPKTYQSNLALIQNLIIPYIGEMQMQKLQPYHIEALYDTLSKTPCGQYVGGKRRDLSPKQQKRTLSGTTLHEVHQLLHNSFLLAVEWGILIKSPVLVEAPKKTTARCRMGSSMLSSAARISSTSQMLRSWVVFLGASTGTGLLIRMPHSTANRKELCSNWWTSWRVVPERVRFCCLGERSRRLPPTYCPQGVLLRVSYRASMW